MAFGKVSYRILSDKGNKGKLAVHSECEKGARAGNCKLNAFATGRGVRATACSLPQQDQTRVLLMGCAFFISF